MSRVTRPGRRGLTAGALGLVVSGILGGSALAWGHGTPSASDACRAVAAASAVRHAEVVGAGPRVVVIGDSYSQGAHLADPSRSWPSMLPGRVVVDGFSGSGFAAAASSCRGEAFGLRVPRALAEHPSLVVVQGGLNDYDVPDHELRAAVRDVLGRLSGHAAVVVGPPDAPSRAAQVTRVDAIIAAAADRAGVPYVRTSGWQLPFLPDRLHLTATGHRTFGRAVAARIAHLTGGLDGLAANRG
jgi:acyl-CoA thioesterase-1